jgi:hypothetical protein
MIRVHIHMLFPLIWHGLHKKQHIHQFFYCCICILLQQEHAEPLPSNDMRNTCTDTQTDLFWLSGIRWHTETHRHQGDLISLSFLQNKESRPTSIQTETSSSGIEKICLLVPYNARKRGYKWIQTIKKFQIQKCGILADQFMPVCDCNPYSTPINFSTNQHFDQDQSHNWGSAAHRRRWSFNFVKKHIYFSKETYKNKRILWPVHNMHLFLVVLMYECWENYCKHDLAIMKHTISPENFSGWIFRATIPFWTISLDGWYNIW